MNKCNCLEGLQKKVFEILVVFQSLYALKMLAILYIYKDTI